MPWFWKCCSTHGKNMEHIVIKNNILLYPKEADFHLRQGTTLLQPADTNLPGFSVTSTGREACLLQRDKHNTSQTVDIEETCKCYMTSSALKLSIFPSEVSYWGFLTFMSLPLCTSFFTDYFRTVLHHFSVMQQTL